MSEEENRAAFEAWVKAPPFSRLTHRWREGVAKGQYLDVSVHLAWKAWCERGKLSTGPVALEAHAADAGLVLSNFGK